jgi:hypothetical protein
MSINNADINPLTGLPMGNILNPSYAVNKLYDVDPGAQFDSKQMEQAAERGIPATPGIDFKQQLAASQTGWQAVKAGTFNALAGTLGEVVSTPGYLLNIFSDMSELEEGLGGLFIKAGDYLKENAQEYAPIFTSEADDDKLFAPFDGKWWGTTIEQLGPTLALLGVSMATGGATSAALGSLANRMGQAGKFAKLAQGFGRTAQGVGGLNQAFTIGSTTLMSRAIEGMMEGRETYHEAYDIAIEEGQTPEEATRYASEAAAFTYRWNWGAMLTDAVQYTGIYGLLGKGLGKFGKALVFAGETGLEGVEEGYQGIVAKEAIRKLYQELGIDVENNTLVDRIGDYLQDREIQKAMVQGAVGATIIQGGGRILASAQDKILNKYLNQQQTQENLVNSEKTIQGFIERGQYVEATSHAQKEFINKVVGDIATSPEGYKTAIDYVESMLAKEDVELNANFPEGFLVDGQEVKPRAFFETQKRNTEKAKKIFDTVQQQHKNETTQYQSDLAKKRLQQELVSERIANLNKAYETEITEETKKYELSPIGQRRFSITDEITAIKKIITESSKDTDVSFLEKKQEKLEKELSEIEANIKENDLETFNKDSEALSKYSENTATEQAYRKNKVANENNLLADDISNHLKKETKNKYKAEQRNELLNELTEELSITDTEQDFNDLRERFKGDKEALEIINAKYNEQLRKEVKDIADEGFIPSEVENEIPEADATDLEKKKDLFIEKLNNLITNKGLVGERILKDLGVTDPQQLVDDYFDDTKPEFKAAVNKYFDQFKQDSDTTDLGEEVVDTEGVKPADNTSNKNEEVEESPNQVLYSDAIFYKVKRNSKGDIIEAKVTKNKNNVKNILYTDNTNYNINWNSNGWQVLKDENGVFVPNNNWDYLNVDTKNIANLQLNDKIELEINLDDNFIKDQIKSGNKRVLGTIVKDSKGNNLGNLSTNFKSEQLDIVRNRLWNELQEYIKTNGVQGKFNPSFNLTISDFNGGRFNSINQQNELSTVFGNEKVVFGVGTTDNGQFYIKLPNLNTEKSTDADILKNFNNVPVPAGDTKPGHVYAIIRNPYDKKYYPYRLYTKKLKDTNLKEKVLDIISKIGVDPKMDADRAMSELQDIVRFVKVNKNGKTNYAPDIAGNFHSADNPLFAPKGKMYAQLEEFKTNNPNATPEQLNRARAEIFYDMTDMDNKIVQVNNSKLNPLLNTPDYNKRIINEGRLSTDLAKHNGEFFHSPMVVVDLTPVDKTTTSGVIVEADPTDKLRGKEDLVGKVTSSESLNKITTEQFNPGVMEATDIVEERVTPKEEVKKVIKPLGKKPQTKFGRDNFPKTKLATKGIKVWDSKTELEWFRKNYPNYPIHVLEVIKNVKSTGGKIAWGLFTDAAVYIAKNAGQGTTYHEAFHLVFTLGLNTQQQIQILNEAREKYPKEIKDKTGLQVEEFLADKFSEFVLNEGKVGYSLKNLPNKIKGWFKRIYEWIKSIATDNINLDELFFRASNGMYKNLSPITKNAKSFEKYSLPEGINTNQELKARLNLINDLYFRNHILSAKLDPKNKYKSISELIKEMIDTKNIEDNVYFTIYHELYERFYDDNGVLLPEYQTIENKINAILTNLFYEDTNGNIQVGPLYKEALKDLTSKYNTGLNFTEDLFDEGLVNENNADKESWQKAVFSSSPFESLNDKMLLWFSSIPKQKISGKNEDGSFIIENITDPDFGEGFPLYENPKDVKSFLINKLAGVNDTIKLGERLEELRGTRPWIDKIINDISVDQDLKTLLFQFVQRQTPGFMFIKQDGDSIQLIDSNRNTVERTIRRDLEAGFKSKADVIQLEDGKNVFNKEKLNKYIQAIDTIQVDGSNVRSRMNGLFEAIGFPVEKETMDYFFNDSTVKEGNKTITNSASNKRAKLLTTFKSLFTDMSNGKDPFVGQNDNVISIVKQIKDASPSYYQSVHRGLEGQKKYNHIRPTFFGKLRQQILDGSFPFEQYQKDSFLKNNIFIGKEGYYTNPAMIENFSFNIIEGIQEDFSKTEYSKLSDLQFEKIAFTLFMGNGKAAIQRKWGNYLLPILETAPVMLSTGFKVYDRNELLNKFVELAQAEASRVETKRLAKEKGVDLKMYRVDSTLLFLNQDGSPLFNLADVNKPETKQKISDWMDIQVESEIKRFDNIGLTKQLEKTQFALTPTALELYTLNNLLVRAHLGALTTGDIAFYKDTEDFFKRAKEIWSPGEYLDINRAEVHPNTQFIFINDIEKLTPSWLDAFKEAANKKGMAQEAIDSILKAFTNEVNITDAQAFITPQRWLEQEYGLGRVTEKTLATFERIMKEEETPADMRVIFQTRKPFIYTHNIIPLTNTKNLVTPLQIKNSEMVLFPSMVKGKPELQAIYNKLVELETTGQGMKATAVFGSGVKAGAYGLMTLNENNQLEGGVTHILDNSAWRLQMETPEHHIDAKNLLGSQLWKLVTGNLTTPKLTELAQEFDTLLNSDINTKYEDLIKELSPEKGISKPLDLILQEAYQRGNGKQFESIIQNIDRNNPKGLLQLFLNPYTSYKAQSLINSLFRNRVTKRKINGGSFYNTSSLGYNDLEVVFKEDGTLDYFEVYLPAWLKDITIESLGGKAKEGIVYRIPTEGKYSMFNIKVKGFLPAESGGNIIMPHGVTTIAGLDFDIDKVYAIFYNVKKNKEGIYEPIPYLTEENSTVEERYKAHTEEKINRKELEELRLPTEFEENTKGYNTQQIFVNTSTSMQKLYEEQITPESILVEEGKLIPIEEFEQLPISLQNTQKARDNRKLDIMREILSESIDESFSPGNFDTIKSVAEKIRELEGKTKENLLPFSNSTFSEIYRRMMDGSALIGPAAINNKSHALFQRANLPMELKNAPVLIKPVMNINGNEFKKTKVDGKYKYEINGQEVDVNNFLVQIKNEAVKLGKINGLNGKTLSLTFNEQLAAVVDNGKDPLANVFNLNLYTTDVFNALLHMGYDLETSMLFTAQPILKALVNKISNKETSEAETISEIKTQYKQDIIANIKSDTYLEKVEEVLNNTFYQTLDVEQLEESIKAHTKAKNDKTSYPDYFYLTQLKVLRNFELMKQNEAKEISNIIRNINTGDNGTGATLSDNLLLADLETRVVENSEITNADEFLTDNSKPINNMRNKGVIKAVDYMTKVVGLPFNNSTFKRLRELMSNSKPNSVIVAKDIDKLNFNVLTALSTELYTTNNVNILTTFPTEFLDIKSKESQKTEGSNFSELFNFFKVDVEDNKARFMLSNSTGLDESQIEFIQEQFRLLAEANPELFRKFVDYNFYAYGFEFTPFSYSHALPSELVSENLVNTIEDNLAEFTVDKITEFYEQFLRNHFVGLKYLPYIKEENLKKFDGGVIVQDLTTVSIQKKPVDFIKSNIDKKPQLFKLTDFNNTEAIYFPVPRLGSHNLGVEYNLDTPGHISQLKFNSPAERTVKAPSNINSAQILKEENVMEKGDLSTQSTSLVEVNNNLTPYYEGNIKPEPNTVFVFGSNPEGRHGAGAAKIARTQFGAIYGQGEGLQGNAYALPTKDLRIKENRGFKSISAEQIIESIKKLYEVAKQNPNKQFKVAYRNTTETSLNGYTGLEMIEMFNNAGNIPTNIIFSKEWFDTGKLNIQINFTTENVQVNEEIIGQLNNDISTMTNAQISSLIDFQLFYMKELEKSPDTTEEAAIEYYKKCKK